MASKPKRLAVIIRSIDLMARVVEFNPSAFGMAAYLVETVGPENLKGTDFALVSCEVSDSFECMASYP